MGVDIQVKVQRQLMSAQKLWHAEIDGYERRKHDCERTSCNTRLTTTILMQSARIQTVQLFQTLKFDAVGE
jgi:hypothetical protein